MYVLGTSEGARVRETAPNKTLECSLLTALLLYCA